jgi:hypothetical protein
MRAGLVAAIAASRAENEGYPKGSTVICAHCFVPLYILTRSIGSGDKSNRTVDAYRPVTVQDIRRLRRDVPSVTAALKPWTAAEEIAHVASIPELRTGSAALCPACSKSFVQVFAPEASEVIDRAYTWRLVTIPPMSGPLPVRSSKVTH